jgi:rubrerythrin
MKKPIKIFWSSARIRRLIKAVDEQINRSLSVHDLEMAQKYQRDREELVALLGQSIRLEKREGQKWQCPTCGTINQYYEVQCAICLTTSRIHT